MKITDFKDVYFTCTGNTCRSPMAERIFKEELVSRGIDSINANSRKSEVAKKTGNYLPTMAVTPQIANINALYGYGYPQDSQDYIFRDPDSMISRGAAKLIMKYFKDEDFVDKHEARAFSTDELEDASIVLTMSRSHKKQLLDNIGALMPDSTVKVFTLGEAIGKPSATVIDPLSTEFDGDGHPHNVTYMALYEDTFYQLSKMIGSLFTVEIPPMKSLYENTLENLVYAQVQNRQTTQYNRPNRDSMRGQASYSSYQYYGLDKSEGTFINSEAVTQMKSEIIGRYHICKDRTSDTLLDLIDDLELAEKDASSYKKKDAGYKLHKDAVRNIIADIHKIENGIHAGKYDGRIPEFPEEDYLKAINKQEIADDLEESIVRMLPAIIDKISIMDRDIAFSGYKTLTLVLRCADMLCEPETMENIYSSAIDEFYHRQK